MESIILKGGKVYLQSEISVNCEEPQGKCIIVTTETVIKALEERMNKCTSDLVAAYKDNKVYKITPTSIFYLGGCYNNPSIEAMQKALNEFIKFSEKGFTVFDTANFKNFTAQELNQIKKALVNHYKEWNELISIVEYHELMQLSTRGKK